MEQTIGQRMVIVNAPGDAGVVGTREVWNKPHDGYMLTANSTVSIGSYAMLGKMKQTHHDWHYYLPIFTPNIICVKGNSPIKSIDDLVALMKSKPGITVLASAGVGSPGHFAAEIFKSLAGITYRHVPYPGGIPAAMAVVSGEAEVVMQLSVEVADLLQNGKLRALAVLSKEPLVIEGYGEIPSIQKSIPSFPDYGSYFGLMLPADAPKDVVAAYDEAFVKIAESHDMKDFAKFKGAVPIAIYGESARKLAESLDIMETRIRRNRGY
jgi:tripartite-type tricarboxylate transporter receptor subunit TctC